MLIWQTMCIVGTLKTYIANKIIIINVIEIKKFHMSTSISSIILKIHIKKFIFISFLFSLTFLVAKQCNKYKEMSFQTQNFPRIWKATVLETNKNSFKPKKKKKGILINSPILKLPKFIYIYIYIYKIKPNSGVGDILWVETKIQKLYYCRCLCLVDTFGN